DFAEPLPAVTTGEGRKTQEPVGRGVEDVLLGAADAGRRSVRLHQRPAGGDGITRPGLGVLLAAAALVVPTPADDAAIDRVVADGAFVAHARRNRCAGHRTALDP